MNDNKSSNQLCCMCLMPIAEETPSPRRFGTGSAHYSEARCVAVLRQEIFRLRVIESAARVYYHGWCRDEATDASVCSEDQHHDARALRDALGEAT